MNIFLYWNCKDNDSKKMYKFLEEDELKAIMGSKGKLYFERKDSFFKSETIEEKIKASDIALFFTHGEDDAILKFRNGVTNVNGDAETLIDKNNQSLLTEKKVIAVCCNSAKILGKSCVENIACRTYIGFLSGIEYATVPEAKVGELKSMIYQSYSQAFSNAISTALKQDSNGGEFVKCLKIQLNKRILENIMADPTKRFATQAMSVATMFVKAADSLIVLGDEATPLFQEDQIGCEEACQQS